MRHPHADRLSESMCYQVYSNGQAALALRLWDPKAAERSDGTRGRPLVSRVLVGPESVLSAPVAIALCYSGLPANAIGPAPGDVPDGARLPPVNATNLRTAAQSLAAELDEQAGSQQGLQALVAAALADPPVPLAVTLRDTYIQRPLREGVQVPLLWGLIRIAGPVLGRAGRGWSFSTYELPLGETDPASLPAIVFRQAQEGRQAPPARHRKELKVRPFDGTALQPGTPYDSHVELAGWLVAEYQERGGAGLRKFIEGCAGIESSAQMRMARVEEVLVKTHSPVIVSPGPGSFVALSPPRTSGPPSGGHAQLRVPQAPAGSPGPAGPAESVAPAVPAQQPAAALAVPMTAPEPTIVPRPTTTPPQTTVPPGTTVPPQTTPPPGMTPPPGTTVPPQTTMPPGTTVPPPTPTVSPATTVPPRTTVPPLAAMPPPAMPSPGMPSPALPPPAMSPTPTAPPAVPARPASGQPATILMSMLSEGSRRPQASRPAMPDPAPPRQPGVPQDDTPPPGGRQDPPPQGGYPQGGYPQAGYPQSGYQQPDPYQADDRSAPYEDHYGVSMAGPAYTPHGTGSVAPPAGYPQSDQYGQYPAARADAGTGTQADQQPMYGDPGETTRFRTPDPRYPRARAVCLGGG